MWRASEILEYSNSNPKAASRRSAAVEGSPAQGALDLIHNYEQRLTESATWCAAPAYDAVDKVKNFWNAKRG